MTVAAASDSLENGFFGKRAGMHLGVESASLLAVRRQGRLRLAVTRLTSDRFLRERTAPVSPEPAFSILHQLGDLDRHACWLAGRRRYSGAFAAGSVSVLDLSAGPQCDVRGPLDAVQYYVPRRTLDEFAQEHGARPISTLTWTRDRRDPFVSTLSSVLLSAIEEDRSANQLFVDQVALSLVAHFAQAYGGLRIGDTPVRAGLAPWQERRAKEMMRARLATDLSIKDVAAECRLTPSHFARMFRKSTGVAPHRFLSELRIEEAKRLMLTTRLRLADIALICGFSDQSYFTRIFSRYVGESPGSWRRNNADAT